MTLSVEIPNAATMMKMADNDFAASVYQSLSRYDFRNMRFNDVAAKDRPILTPTTDAMYFYPTEAEGLIGAGLRALTEFEKTQTVSPLTRERFIIEETRDVLRNMPASVKATEDYKTLCEQANEHVAKILNGTQAKPVYTNTPYNQVAVNVNFKPFKPNK